MNADLIISVAGIPLLGVSLNAALASIETMLDYGMMEAWDKSIREWYAQEFAHRKMPVSDGEDVLLRTFGSIWYDEGIFAAWRPGFWYITDRRLVLWRKEPAENLFEVQLEQIDGFMMGKEPHFQKERTEIYLQYGGSEVARIHVSDSRDFKEALQVAAGRPLERAFVL